MQSPSPQMGEAGFEGLLLKGSMSLDFRVTPFPYKSSSFATPQAGAEQPVLTMEQLIQEMPCGALLCPRLRGKGGAAGTKGGTSAMRRMTLSLISISHFLHPCFCNFKCHITDNIKPFLYVFIGKTKNHVSFFIQHSAAPFIVAFATV